MYGVIMDSISTNQTIDVKNDRSNAFRNGTLGLTTGAIVGGGLGYYATKLANDGIPTDQFVHNVTKEYFIDQSKANSIIKEAGLDIKLDKIKELLKKDNITQDELKTFLEKNKKFFKKELERFNKENPEEVTLKFNKLLAKYTKNFNYIKEQLTKAYDTQKKRFKFDTLNPNISVISEATAKSLKIGKAIKYGARSAIGLGALSFIATKLKEQ